MRILDKLFLGLVIFWVLVIGGIAVAYAAGCPPMTSENTHWVNEYSDKMITMPNGTVERQIVRSYRVYNEGVCSGQ